MHPDHPWQTVDPRQLPIPDWGLLCPECRYTLCGLMQHRCPECGLSFEIEQVIPTWTPLRPPHFRGHERPLPDFGLHCAACSGELAGAGDEDCPACGQRFDLLAGLPQKSFFRLPNELLGSLPYPLIEDLLRQTQIPFIVRHEQPVRKIITGAGPETPGIHVHSSYYFDLLFIAHRNAQDLAAARVLADRVWRCSNCGEEIPGNFEICWSCEASGRD